MSSGYSGRVFRGQTATSGKWRRKIDRTLSRWSRVPHASSIASTRRQSRAQLRSDSQPRHHEIKGSMAPDSPWHGHRAARARDQPHADLGQMKPTGAARADVVCRRGHLHAGSNGGALHNDRRSLAQAVQAPRRGLLEPDIVALHGIRGLAEFIECATDAEGTSLSPDSHRRFGGIEETAVQRVSQCIAHCGRVGVSVGGVVEPQRNGLCHPSEPYRVARPCRLNVAPSFEPRLELRATQQCGVGKRFDEKCVFEWSELVHFEHACEHADSARIGMNATREPVQAPFNIGTADPRRRRPNRGQHRVELSGLNVRQSALEVDKYPDAGWRTGRRRIDRDQRDVEIGAQDRTTLSVHGAVIADQGCSAPPVAAGAKVSPFRCKAARHARKRPEAPSSIAIGL